MEHIRRCMTQDETINAICCANAKQLDLLLDAIRRRYAEIFPKHELMVLSIDKASDQNLQIDNMIRILQNLKA